jgi:uncharacterized spore protein YtfJ
MTVDGHGAEAIARELSQLLQTEANTRTVFGEPVKLEARTVIPVATIEIGAGGGGGVADSFVARGLRGVVAKAKRIVLGASAAGAGGGIAVKVRPVGYLTEENGRVVFNAIDAP